MTRPRHPRQQQVQGTRRQQRDQRRWETILGNLSSDFTRLPEGIPFTHAAFRTPDDPELDYPFTKEALNAGLVLADQFEELNERYAATQLRNFVHFMRVQGTRDDRETRRLFRRAYSGLLRAMGRVVY